MRRQLEGNENAEWHQNGKIKSKKNFKNGLKDGPQTEWSEDGKIKSEKNFKNGKEH